MWEIAHMFLPCYSHMAQGQTRSAPFLHGLAHRSSCCLKQKRGKMLLSDKGGDAKRTNRSLFSSTTAALQLFCVFLEHKITKTHNLPFLCLLTPDSVLQDFAAGFNLSSCNASCLAQAAGGGLRGQQGEREASQEDAHPTSEELAQLQPCETPPHELIPWQCKLG